MNDVHAMRRDDRCRANASVARGDADPDVSRLEELGLVERSDDGSVSVPFESAEIRVPLARVA